MRGKNKYLKYINFTPIKLKIFKSENFSIQTTPEIRKHKYSYSYKNINRPNNHILIKNPSENFLYDKININNLSKSKILLDKSIKNEKLLRNSINKNIRSIDVDSTIKRYNRKEKRNNKYNVNYTYNFKNDYYKKNKTPIKPYNVLNLNENKKRNNNPVVIYVEPRLSQNYEDDNKNYFSENNNETIDNYFILKKIILIQSCWRSYYLRQIVVGGLEKYYSSIAITKYLDNIFFRNKKYLFPIFIEKIKGFIISKKFSIFNYNKEKNNINKFFKGNYNDSMSFEIPSEKKKDCIYYFIKTEQIKSNQNNDKKKFIKKNILLNNIKDYNLKFDKKSKNDNKITIESLYNKKKYNLNNDKFKNRINIKANLINHNNRTNKKRLEKNNTNLTINKINNNNKINLFLSPKKKYIMDYKNKNIYIKKKVVEDSHNNILKKGNSATLISFHNKRKNIKKKEINTKKFIFVLNFIRNKFLYFYYLLFFRKLKILRKTKKNKQLFALKIFEILRRNILRKYFNNIKNITKDSKNNNILLNLKKEKKGIKLFPKRSITYYKKKNSKYNYAKINNNYDSKYENHKIKVNKNNQIKKYKVIKLLKKLIDKKIKKTNNILSKYFLKLKNTPQIPNVNFNFTKKINLNNSTIDNLKRQKIEKTPNKRHIKVKYKKSFSNKTFCSNNSDKKHYLSNSCKKMKISRKIYDIRTYYSTISSDFDSKCKINLINKIERKDNKLFNKVITLIRKLENKNILYKYFTDWKKEIKCKK